MQFVKHYVFKINILTTIFSRYRIERNSTYCTYLFKIYVVITYVSRFSMSVRYNLITYLCTYSRSRLYVVCPTLTLNHWNEGDVHNIGTTGSTVPYGINIEHYCTQTITIISLSVIILQYKINRIVTRYRLSHKSE